MRLAIILSIVLVVSIIPVFADDRDSGIRHVKCIQLQKSILDIEVVQVSEFDYNVTLKIKQNDGKCIMKDKLGKTYLTFWMPVYHRIELIDNDFGIIENKRIIAPGENESIQYKMFEDIPYCVKVSSVWLDNRVRTESTSEKCFKF